MFYVMYVGYVCLATLCGLVLFLVIFITIFLRRRQQDPQLITDHIVTLLGVHCLLGATWVVGLLTSRHGGLPLNVAFCVVNGCLGLAILVRCMVDFRLRTLCADVTLDSLQEDHRRRRRRSQDSWSHDSSPAAVGRTAASLGCDDSRDVFAGNSIITPAPQNGNGWRRLRRADVDKMAASIKYGKPEVHASGGDALHDGKNDVRADGHAQNQNQIADVSSQIGNSVFTSDNAESLTYI